MTYLYRNDNSYPVGVDGVICSPGETFSLDFPAPPSLGLTLIQQGNPPDPVLFHDDFLIAPGQSVDVALNDPVWSHNVALSILCMSNNSGVQCCFGATSNIPVPIDARGFEHVLDWRLCSKLFLLNSTDNDALISVTALEVADS